MESSSNQERATYFSIKEWALNCYYDGCRDHAIKKKWTRKQVLAFVSYMFEDGFPQEIENLMWGVALLILGGGWDPEWDLHWRKKIANTILENSIEFLTQKLQVDELDEFMRDLKVLGFAD